MKGSEHRMGRKFSCKTWAAVITSVQETIEKISCFVDVEKVRTAKLVFMDNTITLVVQAIQNMNIFVLPVRVINQGALYMWILFSSENR